VAKPAGAQAGGVSQEDQDLTESDVVRTVRLTENTAGNGIDVKLEALAGDCQLLLLDGNATLQHIVLTIGPIQGRSDFTFFFSDGEKVQLGQQLLSLLQLGGSSCALIMKVSMAKDVQREIEYYVNNHLLLCHHYALAWGEERVCTVTVDIGRSLGEQWDSLCMAMRQKFEIDESKWQSECSVLAVNRDGSVPRWGYVNHKMGREIVGQYDLVINDSSG